MSLPNNDYHNEHMDGEGNLESEPKRRQNFGKPWREQTLIEDNPIRLSEEVVESMIPDLDVLQSSFWVLYHQYHKHHWLVEGPQFMQLHKFLESHYEEVHDDLDAVAERMTALGGIPTSDPVNQARLSCIRHEPEGTYRIRPSLEHDRTAEGLLSEFMRNAIRKAEGVGDFGTEKLLKHVLFRSEDRAHHLDHFLGEDTLEIGLTVRESDLLTDRD
jgi:DNA-binding ferritin-like protein